MRDYDIVIVGAGVMGAACAWQCTRAGARVALVDQASLPNPRGASIDHSKVFRFAYPDQLYVRMAVEALKLWRRLEQDSGERLLTETGLLMTGHSEPSIETATYAILKSLNLEVERLTDAEVDGRFPQFNAAAFPYAIFDPSGAILHATHAVSAMISLAESGGATVIQSERVTGVNIKQDETPSVMLESGTGLECGRALITSGPWTRELLPQLGGVLTTTQQEVVYFEPTPGPAKFDARHFPIFIDLDSGFYGFPIHHAGAMKISNHNKGDVVDPDLRHGAANGYSAGDCRAFFAEFIPGLADARMIEARGCVYNNTPDDDFIIDWLPESPNLLIATGFSGHGFKFGSLVGLICAELLVKGETKYEIDRFSLERFGVK